MKRVLFLAVAANTGGAERALLDILTELRADYPDLSPLLIAGEEGPLLDQARALGIPAEAIPFPRPLAEFGQRGAYAKRGFGSLFKIAPAVAGYCWRLRRRIRQLAPDVIHSNGFKMHILAALTAPRAIPVIWHLHDYVKDRRLSAKLLRLVQARCRHMAGNSLSVTEDAREVFRPHAAITTILCGVDTARFSPEGPLLDLDALAGLPPAPHGTVRVALIATFARWKGHQVFLEAAARLSPSAPIRFYIIGGPIYQTLGSQFEIEELRSMAAELGLTGRIGFTGPVSDVPAALRSLDIAVHASTEPEPFGLVIAQAMSCAKAVVIARAGGAAELAVEEREALFHTPGNREELAASILRLATDPALRNRLGNAAEARARRDWTRERMTAQFAALYRSLTGLSAPQVPGPGIPAATS